MALIINSHGKGILDMNATIVSAVVRHVLTAVGGGFAVSWGIDGAAWEGIVGAVATIAGLVWSVVDKKKRGG
jgi:hypothetical protein